MIGKMLFIGALSLSMAALPVPARGAVIHVPGDVPTIQAAIDAASDGDTVLVAPGTYLENLDFKGKAILVTSEAGAKDTIVKGLKPSNKDDGSVAIFRNGEGPGTVLEGFKLVNGKGTKYGPSGHRFGGGIFCLDASPVIRDCIVNDNDQGGIACLGASAPRIVENKIAYNVGSGIYIEGPAAPEILENKIASNGGSGIYIKGPAAPEIRGNSILSNQANGITAVETTLGPVEDNTISGNLRQGIRLQGCDASTVRFNEVLDNKWEGIYCKACTGDLHGNHVSGNGRGGIRASGKPGDLLHVSGNTVEGNSWEYPGGGIRCESYVVVTGNLVRNNVATAGAGISCEDLGDEPCVLDHNIITGNHVPDDWGGGAGIYVFSCTNVRIEANVISNNDAGGYTQYFSRGGGIFCETDSEVICTDNLIHGNHALEGGGIFIGGNSGGVLTNNTFWGNDAEQGGAFSVGSYCTVTAVNDIFWNDTARSGKEGYVNFKSELEIRNSDLEGGIASLYIDPSSSLEWGPAMIDIDPTFVDPLCGDFHIPWNSPCSKGGDPAAPELPETDFEGDPWGWTPSIGADQHHRRLYFAGEPAVGGGGSLRFMAYPNLAPVLLWLGSGLLDPPVPTPYGDWYLASPLLGTFLLGRIPAPEGYLSLPLRFDDPGLFYLQAGIAANLTNPLVLEVGG